MADAKELEHGIETGIIPSVLFVAEQGKYSFRYRTPCTAMKIAIVIELIEPGHWRSCCPSLPGCEVIGPSKQDALRNIDLGVRGYLASLNVALPLELNLAISPI